MNGKLVGEGRTAEIWEYKDHKIVKLYREGIPEENVIREYNISQYVHAQGIRTPQPFELLSVEDRRGIVFKQIHGPSLLKVIGKSPWKTGKMARMLAELHCDLHKLDAADHIGRQKEMLRRGIKEAPMLSVDEKTVIQSYLETLPEGNKLCHGDFHPDNVMMDKQVWIIDWMTGLAGDPAGDVARSVVMFSMGAMPPGASRFTELMIGFIRKRLTKGYLREYLKLSGQAQADIERWILPVAAARLVEWIPAPEKEMLVQEIRRRLRSISAG